MSGGYFDYEQYKLDMIADQIQNVIDNNQEHSYHNHNDETLEKFRDAVHYLRLAAVYSNRIDWLLSGDDNEQHFYTRLESDLTQYVDKVLP